MTDSSAIVSFLRRARDAAPPRLRHALQPIVRRVVPDSLRARAATPDTSVAERWVDNRWTILDRAGGARRHFFFICGCYKSGTNWVQNLLNLHPRVSVVGEFHFEALWKGVQQLTSLDWFIGSRPELKEVALDSAEAMVRRMMYAATRDKPGATWLGDRTPHPLCTNIRGAPNILVTRDGRDVLVSWAFHHLRLKSPEAMAPHFRDKARQLLPKFQADPDNFNPLDGWLGDEAWLRQHARQWADIVRASRTAMPELAAAGTPILEVRYEQLHDDLRAQTERLYRFLDLDPAQAAAPSKQTKTLPGFEKENRRSFYRKGQTGEWKDVFDDRVSRIVREEAGDELIASGYATDANW